MINARKLIKVSKLADKESALLSNSFRRNTFVNSISRTKLFKEEEKIQKLREDTFFNLAKALGEKNKSGGLSGALLGVLGIGGAGRVVRRFGGGGGGGLRGKGGVPKLPKGPLAKSLSKFGRIGPLAIASTGLDFFARKQSGQSNLQAGGGALAGLGGFAGGAKLGALLGTAILPGVGTAAGGLIGGALGGLLGGNLFDRLYGQNRLRAGADFRRVEEIERTRQQSTLFGENLDKFEIVLDKFAKKAPRFREQEEEENFIAERIRKSTEGVPLKNRPNALMKIIDTLFDAAIIIFPPAAGKKTVIKKTLANILISKKSRTGSKFLQFSKSASRIKPETLTERMTRAFQKNFGKRFKPQLSPKGIKIRQKAEANKILKELKNQNKVDEIIKNAESTIQGQAAKRSVQKSIGEESLLNKVINEAGLDKRITKPGFNPKTKKFIKKENMTFKGEGTSTNKRLPPNLNNSDGGVMDGPETGYLAVLHGKERIIPEENQFTRSRGSAQTMKTNTIMMIENNKGHGSTGMVGSPQTGVLPIFVEADPFDVATKYSELIARVTV